MRQLRKWQSFLRTSGLQLWCLGLSEIFVNILFILSKETMWKSMLCGPLRVQAKRVCIWIYICKDIKKNAWLIVWTVTYTLYRNLQRAPSACFHLVPLYSLTRRADTQMLRSHRRRGCGWTAERVQRKTKLYAQCASWTGDRRERVPGLSWHHISSLYFAPAHSIFEEHWAHCPQDPHTLIVMFGE